MSSPLLFLIACLIWGSTFWAITLQLGDVAPAISVVYRFGLASATLFAWCALRGDTLRLPLALRKNGCCCKAWPRLPSAMCAPTARSNTWSLPSSACCSR